MSNYIKNGGKYDTIIPMRPDLFPALRAVLIIALLTLPLLLVILQRLDDIREIRQRLKAGERIFNFIGTIGHNIASADKSGEAVCSRCGSGNPRGQAYCGACGNKLGPKESA